MLWKHTLWAAALEFSKYTLYSSVARQLKHLQSSECCYSMKWKSQQQHHQVIYSELYIYRAEIGKLKENLEWKNSGVSQANQSATAYISCTDWGDILRSQLLNRWFVMLHKIQLCINSEQYIMLANCHRVSITNLKLLRVKSSTKEVKGNICPMNCHKYKHNCLPCDPQKQRI